MVRKAEWSEYEAPSRIAVREDLAAAMKIIQLDSGSGSYRAWYASLKARWFN